MTTGPTHFRFGEFALDVGRRRLTRGEREIPIQPKVHDTLHLLLRHADRVVPKDELIAQVWPGVVVTDSVLTRAISALRRALDDKPADSHYIRSVQRVGYRFVGKLERPSPVPQPTAPSLAVLPFRSLPGADRDESLELGMADTLISQLGRVGGMLVRPLSAVVRYATGESSAQDLALQLEADAYLEASIQRRDGRVRVTARLVQTRDQALLWSQSFNEAVEHVFVLQDVICERIAGQLAPHLAAMAPARRPTTPAAYRAYLEARLFLARHTPADLARALALFEDAIDEDPAHAPAWAGVAEAHMLLGTVGDDVASRYESARRASRRALAIDADQADARCALANIAWQHDWDWAGAARLFEDALRHAPNHANLHISCADFCSYAGRADRAIEHAKHALRIDPVSPWVNALLAQTLYMNGRYDEAIAQAEHALTLAPGFAFARLFAGLARFCAGAKDQGVADIELAVASGRVDFVAALGVCYARSGRTTQAEALLAQMRKQGDAAPPIVLALLYLALGRVDEAMLELERCIVTRDWHLLLLRADPTIRPCADVPAVQRLLARLNLPARETVSG